MKCLLCGQPLTDAEAVWRVVHEACEATKKEANVKVDTREIRGTWTSLQKKGLNVVQVIYELCDEVDRLRAEVARLREKAGENVCKACGHTKKVFSVSLTSDTTGICQYDDICRDCIDRALDALKGE